MSATALHRPCRNRKMRRAEKAGNWEAVRYHALRSITRAACRAERAMQAVTREARERARRAA